MKRYYFYLVLLCMFINTIFFVPRLLLNDRFNGMVMAMVMSIVIGSSCAILFTKSMGKFPGQGISDIFKHWLPGFVRVPLLLYFGIMWTIAGSIILISFTMISIRFLNPEASVMIVLLCFCGIGCWAAIHRPQSILYVTEVVICLNLPVIAYIMYKALTSSWFKWDAVLILGDYAFKFPTWKALSAATYSFAGYINLSVYNREFKSTKIKMLWLIPIIGIVVLFTSVVVPVGLLGIDKVDSYIYTWITSADTLRMKFGLIERVLYLFLFVYIGFSLSFITITWNIGSKLIVECFQKQTIQFKKWAIPTQAVCCVLIAVITFIGGLILTDKLLIQFVTQWLMLRFGGEITLVALVVWLAWRSVRKHG